jgi:large subunit ribosomal protein L21
MHAIFTSGGKQYRVQENDIVDVERIPGEVGEKVVFNHVLAIGEGSAIRIGSPVVENAVVEAELVQHHRGDKIVVFKMKRRKGYRRKQGHRQELTQVRIAEIKG